MKDIYSFLLIAMLSFLTGCSDDLIGYDPGSVSEVDADTVEAFLSLSVNKMNVSNGYTRAEDDQSVDTGTTNADLEAAENRIDDIWIFQFDATTKRQLINPEYYIIKDQSELTNIKVLLKEGIPSIICVVANTNDPSWAKSAGFETYDALTHQAIPDRTGFMYITTSQLLDNSRSIPMEGEVTIDNENGVSISSGQRIEVNVSRMYAKLVMSYKNIPEGMSRISLSLNDIPNYCRVKSLEDTQVEERAASYPANIDWINWSYNTGQDNRSNFIVYIPENLHGKIINSYENLKDENAPDKSLQLVATMRYENRQREYKMRPGADILSDYNIKRNTVYNINIRINSASTDIFTPSSNCFVVKTNETLVFEPYYRTETGGQYGDDSELFNFKNYLDPDDTSGKKVIDYVQILWQTKGAIGDNSDGTLITFTKNEQYPIHSTITVTQQPAEDGTYPDGNAVIAAFNRDDEIIWSWHIWRTDNEPDNLGSAVTYTTYAWEPDTYENGKKVKSGRIITEKRVPGYAIMPCNLGALENGTDFTKNFLNQTTNNEQIYRTHGMLYQWGRKDPFPPAMNFKVFLLENYSEYATGIHYDYTNTNKISKTSEIGTPDESSTRREPKVSFYSRLGSDFTTPTKSIQQTIAHPLVFLCGTLSAFGSGHDITWNAQPSNYHSKGDWMMESNNKLWGAIDPDNPEIKSLQFSSGYTRYLYDNYGDKKSIFDPCPKGWRVPPGDLWLGFSSDGRTTSFNTHLNYDPEHSGNKGMSMYMTAWKQVPTMFFPTQGPRLADGGIDRCGTCGNYHNATTTKMIRNNIEYEIVNILHIHNSNGTFQIFENNFEIIQKSIASAVRCVRDRK